MVDLAHNINGEPFDVPAHATAWRVRRMKAGRGAPEVVHDHEGLPLVIPIDAGLEDVRGAVRSAGRYRLDPVDESYRPIESAQAAYLYVYPQHLRGPRNGAQDGMSEVDSSARETGRMSLTENAFIEMAKATTALAQSVVHAMTHQFPAMVASVAELVRAADGAGMPARPPVALPEAREDDDDDDDGDDDDELPEVPPAPGPDLATVVAQLLPSVLAAFTQRTAAPSAPAVAAAASTAPHAARPAASAAPAPSAEAAHLRAILQSLTPQDAALVKGMIAELSPEDASAWKAELAALSVAAAVERIRRLLHGEPTPAPAAPAANDAPPPLPPEALAHLLAIQQALTPQEAALAQALAANLAPDDARAWMAELSALSVPAAVDRIRGILHGAAPKQDASAASATAGAPGAAGGAA